MSLRISSQLPILFIDDDSVVLEIHRTALESEGITNVLTLSDSRKTLQFLEDNPVSVIILDLMMPHISGLDLLPLLIRDFPQIPVIVMTSSEDIESAVNCIKTGAVDYLTKPIEIERLIVSVENALRVNELYQENRTLRDYLLNDSLEHPAALSL